MSEELEILKEVTQRLEKVKIVYVISGSIAANYYTIPRMTRDLDVIVEMKDSDISRFIRSFKADFFVDEEVIREEVKNRGMFNLIHTKYAFKVDFIVRKETAWQKEMFSRRQKIRVDNISAWLITIEDLILAKLLWAKDSLSELQLNDVRNLLESKGAVDRLYVEKWVLELALEHVYQKVRK